MEGTTGHGDKFTRGVWLGQWSRLIGNIRLDKATGMLCRTTFGLKRRCTYFLASLLQYRDLLEPSECNISGTYYWDNETQV